jgi:hypothetical protein
MVGRTMNNELSEAFKPYSLRCNEFSCEQGYVLWGTRVIIPPKFREKILDELHWEHPGICSMKALACSFVWWPKIDEEIEGRVKSCSTCKLRQKLHPWMWCTRPFQRIHIDFCEDKKQYFLVLIDSRSKWVDVKAMT